MSKKKSAIKKKKTRNRAQKKPQTTAPTLKMELEKALQLQRNGRYNQAEQIFHRILKSHPNHSDSIHYLGIIAFQRGHLDLAIQQVKQSIELFPACITYYRNLAAIFEKKGDLDQAIEADKIAMALSEKKNDNPQQIAQNHLIIGNDRFNQKKFHQAIEHYQQVLKQQPENLVALLGMGKSLMILEKTENALPLLHKALTLAPNNIHCLESYTEALYLTNKLGQALQHCQHMLTLIKSGANFNYLGNIYKLMGDLDNALKAYQQSLELEYRFETLANLADMYERRNQINDALETAEKGLQLQPQSIELNLVAARCETRQKNYSQCVQRLTDALNSNVPAYSRQLIHFELGRAYDFLHQSEQAYQHFCLSGQLQQQEWNQKSQGTHSFYQEVVDVTKEMTPTWIQSWSSITISDDYPDPIFLIGFPRSGTTLLDQILDSHSALQLMEEKPPLNIIKNIINDMPNRYPNAIADLETQQIHQLRQRYFNEVNRVIDRQPQKILVDKLPLNITNIALIYRFFPKAKFILAIRHPCDICLSCFMQSFELNSAMSNFTTLEQTVNTYVTVMHLWEVSKSVIPLTVHINRYEDLVNDFETATTKILDFLQLDWEEKIKNYNEHAKKRYIKTPSYSQASRPIYKESTFRWLRYQKQFAPFMSKLNEFILRYGYHTQNTE